MKRLTQTELNKLISKVRSDEDFDKDVLSNDPDAFVAFIVKMIDLYFDYDTTNLGLTDENIIMKIIDGKEDEIVTEYEAFVDTEEEEHEQSIELIKTDILNYNE